MKKNQFKLYITIFILSLTVIFSGVYTRFSTQENGQTTDSTNIIQQENYYIGLLQFTSHPSLDAITDGVIDTLSQHGYKDGERITLDFQNGQGDQSNLNAMSTRFVSNDADIMIAIATPAALAVSNASNDIPIILGAITDPENVGLVETNEQPGGNVTGVSDMTPIAQQLELIRQLQPEAKTIGLLYSSSEDNAILQGEMAADLATEYGFETVTRTVASTNDVAQVTNQLVVEVDAIWTPNDNVIASAFPSVLEVANNAGIPVYPAVDIMVAQGGIATLGLNQYQIGVKTGEMVVALLNGEIETASEAIRVADESDLVINFETAERLGIEIPESLRAQAIDARDLMEEE